MIPKIEFLKNADLVASLVHDRDNPEPGKKPIGFKDLEKKYDLKPRNGMNAYDVYHSSKGDQKQTPLQEPKVLVHKANLDEILRAKGPIFSDTYDLEVAYGRGWRAGCNYPHLECPYPDEGADDQAHAWMDGYEYGRKAHKKLGLDNKIEAERLSDAKEAKELVA